MEVNKLAVQHILQNTMHPLSNLKSIPQFKFSVMAFCIIAGNVPQNNHTANSMLLHLGAADAFTRHHCVLT